MRLLFDLSPNSSGSVQAIIAPNVPRTILVSDLSTWSLELAPVYDLSAVNQRDFRHFQFLVQRDSRIAYFAAGNTNVGFTPIRPRHPSQNSPSDGLPHLQAIRYPFRTVTVKPFLNISFSSSDHNPVRWISTKYATGSRLLAATKISNLYFPGKRYSLAGPRNSN